MKKETYTTQFFKTKDEAFNFLVINRKQGYTGDVEIPCNGCKYFACYYNK